jgi:hypothetical protein
MKSTDSSPFAMNELTLASKRCALSQIDGHTTRIILNVSKQLLNNRRHSEVLLVICTAQRMIRVPA